MSHHFRPAGLLGLCSGVLIHLPAPAAGQSVADVVEDMYAAYERYVEGIENYSIVHRSMGASTVSYFERELVDGEPIFRLRESSSGTYAFTLDGEVVGYGDVFLFGPVVIERGRYLGREELGGREAHVLGVDNLRGLVLTGPAGPDEIEFVPSSARIYVDAEFLIPIGFDFVGRAVTADGPSEVSIRSRLSDVRERDGLLVPNHTVIEIDGLEAVVDPAARERLAELREQLDHMPPVQRQLMEEMMAEEMESLRRMMGGDGRPAVIEIDVTSVAVNRGPPGRQ